MNTKQMHSFLKTIIIMFMMALGAVSTTYGVTADLVIVSSASHDTNISIGEMK